MHNSYFQVICDETNNSEEDVKADRININILLPVLTFKVTIPNERGSKVEL